MIASVNWETVSTTIRLRSPLFRNPRAPSRVEMHTLPAARDWTTFRHEPRLLPIDVIHMIVNVDAGLAERIASAGVRWRIHTAQDVNANARNSGAQYRIDLPQKLQDPVPIRLVTKWTEEQQI